MAFLFKPAGERLASAGLGRFAHVPFILSADMAYLDEANLFLRERAVGKWHPNRRSEASKPTGAAPLPSENTMLAYARDLENAITFFEAHRLDWRRIEYADLLEKYDAQMGSGRWSADKAPLGDATINRRLDRAVEFLSWCGDRGFRPPFHFPTELKSQGFHQGGPPHRRREPSEVRVGRRRVHPRHLRLPTAAEIGRWISEVAVRRGKTKALMCRMILETGTRLEEAALVRAVQLPDPDAVEAGKPARMEICFGTKGSRVVGDPDRRGKRRALRFSTAFLRELVNYKQLRRAKALAAFRSLHPGESPPPQLFLSERTGEPITAAALYKAWHQNESLPFPGFSPHTGRHTFACFTLLRLIREEAELIAQGMHAVPKSVLLQHATNLIEIYIRPVLGHVSAATTERYVGWVSDHLHVAEHRAAWTDHLEGGGVG